MISSLRGGGSERQTVLIAQHLDRSRFEPHLYVTERAGELLNQVASDVPIHAYSDHRPKPGLYYPGRALRDQTYYVGDLLRRESIDVIYDRTFHMTLVAAKPSRQLDIPRVSTIVSPPDRALPLVEPRFTAIKRRRIARAYQDSHAVVAVSEAVAESARRYYHLSSKPVRVIHNGVDIDSLVSDAEEPIIERGEGSVLVCVGRMTTEKGHADLIDALGRLERDWPATEPPLTVWMIGDGPLRRSLQVAASRKCRRHQIKFLGQLENPTGHILAADALVLPSRFEGLPNVVLEAMALSTAVIATRSGGTVELQREEPTICWANAADPKSLANAIRNFLSDRHAAVHREGAAWQLVQQHHDIHQVVHQIEACLT